MMRIIHAILNTRLNAVIIHNCITKCALKWHVDRFGTSLMKAARENAQINHYMFIGAIDLAVHILKIFITHILLQYMLNI